MFTIDPHRIKLLHETLEQRFGEDVYAFELIKDIPTFLVKKSRITELFRFLFHEDDLQFRFLTTLCGIHYPENKEQIGVVYHLHSFKYNFRIRIKSFTTIDT